MDAVFHFSVAVGYRSPNAVSKSLRYSPSALPRADQLRRQRPVDAGVVSAEYTHHADGKLSAEHRRREGVGRSEQHHIGLRVQIAFRFIDSSPGICQSGSLWQPLRRPRLPTEVW